MRTISAQSITDTVARLCIKANTQLPQDVQAALEKAREEEPWPLAKNTLDLLWSNLGAAKEKDLPICQDTGMACVFVELGTDVHIDGSFETAIHEGVRRGYTDGYLTQLPESVYQQHLFDQSYVCLAAENHPRIRAQLRAEDWRQEKHLAIRVEGTAHGDMDKLLDEHHMPRRIALTLPSFLGTGELVAESDMIAVVPEQVARHITRRYPCRSWPLPFPLAKIAIRQVWHQRLHRDPGHIWLRSLIATLADPAQQSTSIKI